MVHDGESWLNMVNNWNNVGKTMSQTTHDWQWFIITIKMVNLGMPYDCFTNIIYIWV
jgi:hypothetical protein